MSRALLLFPLLAACSRDYVEGSDFTYSDEEWTLESGFSLPTMSIVEVDMVGTPPFICGRDTGFSGARFWRFKAPDKFYGNASRAFGQRLTWATMTEFPGGVLSNRADVFLGGRGETIGVNIPNSANRRTRAWVSFEVFLDERSDWRKEQDGSKATDDDIKAVLRNLSSLSLPGEWLDGMETSCIDDVYFGTP